MGAEAPTELSPLGRVEDVRGAVEGVAAADAGWWSVTIAGAGPAERRTLLVSGARAPFAVGEALDVRRERVAMGMNASDEWVVVADARGPRLLTFTSAVAPEGWGARGLGAGPDCRVAIEHAGVQAVVASRAWRRLVAPDGAWDVSAICPPPVPNRAPGAPVTPDYVPATIFVSVSRAH